MNSEDIYRNKLNGIEDEFSVWEMENLGVFLRILIVYFKLKIKFKLVKIIQRDGGEWEKGKRIKALG